MIDTSVEATSKALWSGRFKTSLAELAHRFSSSIAVDGKLYREDIAGSIAHVRMLTSIGVLNNDEAELIVHGLQYILGELESGELSFSSDEEDIHMAIETKLTEAIGTVAGKLHTGRSRNDQVALDERLYLKRVIPQIAEALKSLQLRLVVIAEAHIDTIMPGYTHLQRAQPVLLAHHLLAYVEMFDRDNQRLKQCIERLDFSPLGSAAFAGSPFPLDRQAVASELGFSGIVRNSIDAVSDRDHLIEIAAIGSMIMMHLSRMAEELILWSTTEFGFVQMSDAVTTGSSIMPQKKNPDMAELVRGKTGKVYGALINLLTIMKGLPLAYNRDMQEDKQPMFDVVDTVLSSVSIMDLVLSETSFNTERMYAATIDGYLSATEMADYLVGKGMAFREAHAVTGRVVSYCISRGLTLEQMSLCEMQNISSHFDEDVYPVLKPEASIKNKSSAGSTNTLEVGESIRYWRNQLS